MRLLLIENHFQIQSRTLRYETGKNVRLMMAMGVGVEWMARARAHLREGHLCARSLELGNGTRFDD